MVFGNTNMKMEYYIKKEKWIPAIKRFQIVIKEYDQTIFVEEAIHRLVEVNYIIGQTGIGRGVYYIRYIGLLGWLFLRGSYTIFY